MTLEETSYLEHLQVVSPSPPEEYPRSRSEAKKEDDNFQDRVRVGEVREKLKENEDIFEDIGWKE